MNATENIPTNGTRPKKPFVMIDGFNLSLEKGTGVATYARNLSYCLRDLDHEVGVIYGGKATRKMSPILKEIAFFDSNAFGDEQKARWRRKWGWLSRSKKNVFEIPINGNVVSDVFRSKLPYYDSIWNAVELFNGANFRFRSLKKFTSVASTKTPDIMHWTYPFPLSMSGCPNIYTLHDLVPLRLPYTTLDNKKNYLRMVSKIAENAAHIVTVSECSKRDIVNLLGVPEDRVTNTYQAVTIPDKYRFKPEEQLIDELKGTFGLQYKDYFLFFGSIEPKKNIGRLIEAYLSSNASSPLVLVGAQAWKSQQELALLDGSNIGVSMERGEGVQAKRRNVIQLKYTPFSLLVSLIRGAKGVLFPSLYEGFGLPVLEAMLLGTPVLSSNTSSIPEVAGDAALLIDPYSPQAIMEGIRALDQNVDLRASLSAKGFVQAALFSEAAYAKRTSELYARLLKK